MLTLIHGNRQEVLAHLLAHPLKTDPAGLFEEDIVLVQSEAMERWLRLFLAEHLGIAAQLRCPFPAGYQWELFAKLLPEIPQRSPLARDRMHWHLFRLLGELDAGAWPDARTPDGESLWAPLKRYLRGDELRRQDALARQLAATYDRYVAFRGDWLAAWSEGRLLDLGQHEAWQAALWRRLAESLSLPPKHPRDDFLTALENLAPGEREKLPRRLQFFGVGNLPPAYLEIFQALARHVDVTFYLLDPCAQYWGDLVASREKARAALDRPDQAIYLDVGHPLLGSLGRLTRQFLDRAVAGGADPVPVFVAPDSHRLLGRLQTDLLQLQQTQAPLAEDDRSIQIHIAHGPRREVEILQDQLLAQFAANPDLRPSDVLVLVPDMEQYASLIEAVFATQPPEKRIPYTLADRPASRLAPLLQGFFALFDLAPGRLEAESVLDFFANPPVARRLGFDEADLGRLRDWVRAAAIRWGVDAEWRATQGLPPVEDFSWRQGLERLLLGVAVALPAEGHRRFGGPLAAPDQAFAGRWPAVDVAGQDAQLLGRFLRATDDLFAVHAQLNQAHGLDDWTQRLEAWLTGFFDPADQPADLRAAETLRRAWQAMAEGAAEAAMNTPVPLPVIRQGLQEALQAFSPIHGFFGGGVTFAALRAWRAVPAKVICLLGMNDGAFPHNPVTPSFDLTQGHPRPGDRSPRDEDRQALLDVLLGARETLYLSYCGRSIRDNTPLPPASVLGELLETLRASVGEAGLAALTVVHPLQGFSRRYFDGTDPALYSFAEDYAAASRAAQTRSSPPGSSGTARPFLAASLPPPPQEAGASLGVENLVAFLRNPARALLRDRLGVRLEESEGLLESAEPFRLTGLEALQLDQSLVQDALSGANGTQALALARARAQLPPGGLGDTLFAARWAQKQSFVAALRRAFQAHGELQAARALNFRHSGGTLLGRQQGLSAQGWLQWQAREARAPDLLDFWVRHLLLWASPALNGAAPGGPSRLLTPDAEWQLPPMDDAARHLGDLLALYAQGQCRLLPFFPRTAYAWIQEEKQWLTQWQRDEGWCESQDPWFNLAWQGIDPFAPGAVRDEFESLARAIYAPLGDRLLLIEKKADS